MQKMYNKDVREYLARAGLLILSVSMALLVGEALVRILGIGPDIYRMPEKIFRLSENPTLRYEHVPNIVYENYVINKHGLRGKEFPREKSADVFRIAVVGDSISFGWNVAEGQAWPDVLQRLLDDHPKSEDTSYQVLNYAVTGYNASQIAEMVTQRVAQWKPDLILYGYCLNDPQEHSIEYESLLDRLEPRSRSWLRESALRILSRSRLMQLAIVSIRPTPQDKEDDAEKRRRNDPQFHALDLGRGAEYYRELHEKPTSFRRVMNALSTMKREAPTIVLLFPVFHELENELLLAAHNKVKNAAERHGMGFEDLTEYFLQARRYGGYVNRDSLHLSPQGHEMAGKFIQGVVLRYLEDRHFVRTRN